TNRIVTVSRSGGRIWNADTGEIASAFLGPIAQSVEVVEPAFTPDSSKLVVAGNSFADSVHEIQLWDTKSGRAIGTAFREQNNINRVILNSAGSSVLVLSNGSASLWHANGSNAVKLGTSARD